MLNYDGQCSVCNKPMISISRSNFITKKTGWDWENDSTMSLINAAEVECNVRFCTHCLHLTLFPKFDTDQLYTPVGPEVRKTFFEKYNLGKKYSKVTQSPANAFFAISNEMHRYYIHANLIDKNIKYKLLQNEIKIIDWGGGDGYVGNLFAKTFERTTGIIAKCFVYDPVLFNNTIHENHISREQLESITGDIIILSHTLEHVHNPRSLLSDIYSHTNENGLVLIEVPDQREIMIRALTGHKFGLHYHVNFYTTRSLALVMKNAGFCNVTSYYIHSSFHGQKIYSVFAIGQKINGTDENKNRIPTIPYEFIMFTLHFIELLFLFVLRKVFPRKA